MKKTIRLAVAMDINGEWKASGWSVPSRAGSMNAEDGHMAHAASGVLNQVSIGYMELQYVEVEIDIPERPNAVQGKVVR